MQSVLFGKHAKPKRGWDDNIEIDVKMVCEDVQLGVGGGRVLKWVLRK
jgi:hypothetical protein